MRRVYLLIFVIFFLLPMLTAAHANERHERRIVRPVLRVLRNSDVGKLCVARTATMKALCHTFKRARSPRVNLPRVIKITPSVQTILNVYLSPIASPLTHTLDVQACYGRAGYIDITPISFLS